MKTKSTVLIVALFASIGLFASAIVIATAEDRTNDPASGPTTARVVKIQDCHITTIDSATLASDRAGILKHIEFKEGQFVTEGSLVALIDDEVAKANLAVAKHKAEDDVEVRFAEVAEKAAAKEYEINKSAFEKARSVSELDVDKAKLAWEKAKLSIDKAKQDHKENQLKHKVSEEELKTYRVIAGFPGTITKVYKKKYEAVRQGDSIADIVSVDRVRVEGKVDLADLRFIKQGAKVRVRLFVDGIDLPEEDEIFEGRITFVDLVSGELDHTTQVYVEVQNRDNILRAGLKAHMEIDVDEETTKNVTKSLDPNGLQKKLTEIAR